MADESKNVEWVVAELGHHTLKVGLAGEDKPRAMEAPFVWRSSDGKIKGGKDAEKYSSKAVRVAAGELEDHYDDWEALMRYAYSNMARVSPKELGCCLAIKNNPTIKEVEKMTQILFEEMDVAVIRMENEARLQIMSTGNITGLVIDAGHAGTVVTPVYEGYALSWASPHWVVAGGAAVTQRTKAAMRDAWGVAPKDSAVEHAIEQACYCGVRETANGKSKLVPPPEHVAMPGTIELPDGQEFRVVDEVNMTPAEVLFTGERGVSDDLSPVAQAAVMQLHLPLQQKMWNNVWVVGGASMMPGYKQRVSSELNADVSAAVHANTQRHLATWVGASVLCALNETQSKGCFTKQTYDEVGPGGCLRECTPFTNF